MSKHLELLEIRAMMAPEAIVEGYGVPRCYPVTNIHTVAAPAPTVRSMSEARFTARMNEANHANSLRVASFRFGVDESDVTICGSPQNH